jgi:DNA invertase Pin-like site-specific DNA recombinase
MTAIDERTGTPAVGTVLGVIDHAVSMARAGVQIPAPAGSALGLTAAAKYLRISNDKEGKELGVTRQNEDLDAMAAKEGLYFVDTYPDNDISASTRSRKKRPQYKRMLADARNGRFQVIAAYTTKRLTRRPRENEDLIELAEAYGISYKYIRSPEIDLNTAQGRMLARIMAAADAAEAEITSELVARKAQQRAESGQFNGGRRPFGFGVPKVVNGVPVVNEDTGKPVLDYDQVVEREADFIRWAAQVVLPKEGLGLRTVARLWNEWGVETSTGTPWTGMTVRDMLIRPRNAGLMVYRGQILEGVKAPWEPIIEREVLEALVAKFKDPSRRTSPGNKPRHLLTGALRCGHAECMGKGHRMRVSNKVQPDGSKRENYRCAALGHNWINRDALDHMITNLVLAWLEKPENADILATEDNDKRVKEQTTRAAALREKKVSIKKMWQENLLSDDDLRIMIPEIDRELEQIESFLADAAGVTPLKGIVGRPDAVEQWMRLDIARQKAIVELLMTITITSSTQAGGRRKGGSLLDESRVHIEWRV